MTEQMAIDIVRKEKAYMDSHAGKAQSEAFEMAIKALEENQQYKALGTVEDIQLIFSLCKDLEKMTNEYQKIGTVEELRVARDKQIEFCEWEYDELEEKWQTDCDVLFTIHDSDREITNYCPCCGKKIKVRCEDDI